MKRTTSGSSGRGGFLATMAKVMTSRIGRQLLTRQPPNLTPKVPLDGVVIGLLKQQLPAFYAMDISSLNRRFHLTKFEKPTVFIDLEPLDTADDELVDICLEDQGKTVPDSYKERKLAMPVADLAKMLVNISGQGIVRGLFTCATPDEVPLLIALLKVEKLSPRTLQMSSISCHQDLFAAVVHHLAKNTLRKVAFHFANDPEDGEDDTEVDWRQLNDCLLPLTKLKELSIRADRAMPPSDWLKNLLKANSQLKLLKLTSEQLGSPIVTEAVSAVASMPVVRVVFHGDDIFDHVDADLCGQGPCTLTTIALNMPKTSMLKLVITCYSWVGDGLLCGDALRLAYYLLSLSKTGSRVVEWARFVLVEHMEQFLDDLRHYHPKMALMWHTDGKSVARISASHRRWPWHYVVRLGSVKLYLQE